jgi:hypothetical protein
MVEKYRTSDRFGDRVVAAKLKSARIKAGFRSAASAALTFGWSADTLRGHESGIRGVSEKDARKYAAAFNEDERTFLPNFSVRESESQIARELEKLREAKADNREGEKRKIADRLRFARIVRGFPTLASAAEHTGMTLRMVNTHENAINAISERVAEAYSLAYGVQLGWLLRGDLPSGLGDQVDRAWTRRREGSDIRELAKSCRTSADPMPARDPTNVRTQFSENTPESEKAEAAGDRVYELKTTRAWETPLGLMSKMIGSNPSDVVVVTIDSEYGIWKNGDRVFVDRSKRDISSGGIYAYADDERGVVLNRHDPGDTPAVPTESLLGKVVAMFTWHVSDKDLTRMSDELLRRR